MSDFNPLNALAGTPLGNLNALAPGGQPPQPQPNQPGMNFNILQQLMAMGNGTHAPVHDFNHGPLTGNPRFGGRAGMGMGPVMTPGGGGGNGPIQGAPNTQFPLNPGQMPQMPPTPAYGGIGSQLGVIGANPAGSPFGLPSY